MQTATREAAHQVREAEQRAAGLSREMDALKCDASQEQAKWSAAQAEADQQQEMSLKAVAEATRERDAAHKELSKCKAELEMLRHHVLDAEESATRREAFYPPSVPRSRVLAPCALAIIVSDVCARRRIWR